MGHYSRKIEAPTTRQQGFENNVQMIINAIEDGNAGEALLIAVDLLDTISGKANPFASITAANAEADGFKRMIDELKRQHVAEIAAAIRKATDAGIDEGRRLQKQETAKLLGLT